jgi:hypothetical protein
MNRCGQLGGGMDNHVVSVAIEKSGRLRKIIIEIDNPTWPLVEYFQDKMYTKKEIIPVRWGQDEAR